MYSLFNPIVETCQSAYFLIIFDDVFLFMCQVLRKPTIANKTDSQQDVGYFLSVQSQETVFFRDGERKVDFVLARDATRDTKSRENMRQIFEENLMREGELK